MVDGNYFGLDSGKIFAPKSGFCDHWDRSRNFPVADIAASYQPRLAVDHHHIIWMGDWVINNHDHITGGHGFPGGFAAWNWGRCCPMVNSKARGSLGSLVDCDQYCCLDNWYGIFFWDLTDRGHRGFDHGIRFGTLVA